MLRNLGWKKKIRSGKKIRKKSNLILLNDEQPLPPPCACVLGGLNAAHQKGASLYSGFISHVKVFIMSESVQGVHQPWGFTLRCQEDRRVSVDVHRATQALGKAP